MEILIYDHCVTYHWGETNRAIRPHQLPNYQRCKQPHEHLLPEGELHLFVKRLVKQAIISTFSSVSVSRSTWARLGARSATPAGSSTVLSMVGAAVSIMMIMML